MSASEKIRELKRRRKSMDLEYQQWEPTFRSLRDAIMPSRGRFDVGGKAADVGLNKKIIDTAAMRGVRTLRAGLMSGMTSPTRPWFRLGLYDDDLMEKPAVKSYLETAQRRMYTVLKGSNLYGMLDQCYGDIGVFGTFAAIIVGHQTKVVHAMAMPLGTYRIAEDEDGTVNTMHYDCRRTVAQVVERFGYENCTDLTQRRYDRGDLHAWVDIVHCIEPRLARDTKSPLAKDMAWASYYYEKDATDRLLLEAGFERNPILAPRWEDILGETYSVSSPGMIAYGDCIQLQAQQREKALAVQLMNRPPMLAPAGFKRRYSAIPGGVTTIESSDLSKGGLRPAHEVRPDITALLHDINETRRRISEAFFEDLFMLTINDDRRQITAREIAERHEEKLLVLGPVLEALDHSLLQPVIEATFGYMQESQLLPPAPEELQGQAIKIDYVSLLAQAQKMVGTASIERTVGFVGSLAQIKPSALDLLNEDEAVRQFADQIGAPVDSIRTEEQVASIREQRLQQQQMQQVLEQVQPMAQSAKLISEANERSEATLQQQRRVI